MAKNPCLIEAGRQNGRRVYRAYRKLRVNEVDRPENREYAGTWCASRGFVEALIIRLNEKEDKRR